MNKTILLVEDNHYNARLFQKMLHKYPHTILVAGDATTSLRLLEDNEVDLIFLDINLPDIDGLTLVRQLKAVAGRFRPFFRHSILLLKSLQDLILMEVWGDFSPL